MNDDYLSRLNKKQYEAVIYTEKPLFLVAGAGTGKTMTLTAKLAYLIEQGYTASRLLAMTLTNKAAREMKNRVTSIVGATAKEMWVSTFHSFGLKFLKRHIEALNIGYNDKFTVIDEDDSIAIVRGIIKNNGYDIKVYPPKEAKRYISEFKNNIINVLDSDHAEIYDEYQKILLEDNLVDFDDLLIYTLKILKDHQTIKEYYENYFQYILIDEFQDTNKIQFMIIKELALSHGRIFVVGDPDQSIYSFRGADYHNNKNFVQEFKATQMSLADNYRSTNNILTKANTLIKKNVATVERGELHSKSNGDIDVSIKKFNSDYEEAEFVCHDINRLILKGCSYSEIAVLYRSGSISRIFEDRLRNVGIPYIIYGGIPFFERKEVKDVLAYIRVILDNEASFFLKRIINTPARQIGKVTLEKIESEAKRSGVSFYEAIEHTKLSKGITESLKNFKEILNKIRVMFDNEKDLSSIIDNIIGLTGYKEMLKADGMEGKDRLDNIEELKNTFASGMMQNVGTYRERVSEILENISLATNNDKVNTDGIILSTYHQVKGLEYENVYMVAMEEGIFPDARAFSLDSVEEERRIAYVGITRAKKQLTLSYSTSRFRFGDFKSEMPSRFISEIGESVNKIKRNISIRFKEGDKITHDYYGDGIIVEIDDDIATIAFGAGHGVKSIDVNHKSLKLRVLDETVH